MGWNKVGNIKGVAGAAGTITVGTVATGAPGTDVIITNSGTSQAAILNITIPQGEQGIPGTDTSGGTTDYNDLTNLPTLGTAAALNVPLPQSAVVNLATDLAAITTQAAADEASIATNATAIAALATRATTDEIAIAANGAAVTALQARATVDEGNITSLEASRTTDEAAITALGARATTDETNIASNTTAITTLQGRATTDETAITANGTAITALQARATVDETAITALQTRATTDETAITGLQTSRTTDETNIASNTSAIGALQTRATTDETNITANATAVTALQGRATTDETAITALQVRATADEVTISANGTAITALQTRATVDETAITGLQTSRTADESTLASHTASLAALGTASTKNVPASGNASSTQVVLGSDTRLTPVTTLPYSAITGTPALGTAAPLNVPASGNASTSQVVLGSDTRLVPSVSANANNKATLGSDSLILVQGTASATAATTHAQTVSGDDPQLTNARTPTAHGSTHNTSDLIPLASSSAAGLCPAVDNTTIQVASSKLAVIQSGLTPAYANVTGTPGLAYTLTTSSATMPAWPASVNIPVGSSGILFALNEFVKIPGIGQFQITAIPDSTHLTLQNLAMKGNVASGTSIPSGSVVLPIAGPVFQPGDFSAPIFDDFNDPLSFATGAGNQVGTSWYFQCLGSGSGVGNTYITYYPTLTNFLGGVYLSPGTASTGQAGMSKGQANTGIFSGFTGFDLIFLINPNVVSNATNTVRYTVGIHGDQPGVLTQTGTWIVVEHGNAANANWRVGTGLWGSLTYTDTGVAVVAGTNYTIRMQMNQAWTSMLVYINGVLTNTITSFAGITIGTNFQGIGANPCVLCTKTAGTTASVLIVDAVQTRWITGR